MERFGVDVNENVSNKEEAIKIKSEIQAVEVGYFDKNLDGFITPLGEKSQYDEQDWKTLRTESFLAEHDEWKQLVDSKKEWVSAACKETWFNSNYGHNIDARNRALDQIRFEGIEKKGLTEDMITAQFSKFGYKYDALVKKIISEYNNIKSSAFVPEKPSESYQKTSAYLERQRLAVDKHWAIRNIKEALLEIKDIESKKHGRSHEADIFLGVVLQKEQDLLQEKESNIKQHFMDIPEQLRSELRQRYASELKRVREEALEESNIHKKDYDSALDMYSQHSEKRIAELMATVERYKKELEEIKEREAVLAAYEPPTNDDQKAFFAERDEEVERKINKLILTFKVEGFDEFESRRKIKEIEDRVVQLSLSIPYLENGEPNRNTLDVFKKDKGLV